CIIGSVSILFDLLKEPQNIDLISTFSMATAWGVGFGALGIMMRLIKVKGFGWAMAAVALLGIDAVAICNCIENEKYQSPSMILCLILTVIFIGISIYISCKSKK
ncbi:MAG: hypothetical protein IJ297_08430, partial [Clostridia bacterium]|nr:hypothetical protein [Clostridia bacterium]